MTLQPIRIPVHPQGGNMQKKFVAEARGKSPPLPSSLYARSAQQATRVFRSATRFASISNWRGLPPCEACNNRAQWLKSWSLRMRERPSLDDGCRNYAGPCTGFGQRRCVVAPTSFDPDAPVMEHCCSGWFQYPWIQICEGQPPQTGCAFCFW